MAAYDVTTNVTARVNVYNLADERYIDSIGGGHLVPGPAPLGCGDAGFPLLVGPTRDPRCCFRSPRC